MLNMCVCLCVVNASTGWLYVHRRLFNERERERMRERERERERELQRDQDCKRYIDIKICKWKD